MKDKARTFGRIICLAVFFLALTAGAYASPESQALVDEGRTLLFNYGDPTYSGMLAANEKFEAAVAADPADQEANLFYAVTRVLAFALEQGTGAGLETLRDMLEAFGMARNENDSIEESPYNDPPETYGYYDPPDTIPTGEEFRTFMAEPFVNLLDEALANLAVIDNSLVIILTAEETGDVNIEVDYGDVLLFKSALYTLKTVALMISAYDLDFDIGEMVALGNAGVLQIQRDLLDQYPDLLALGGDGASSLTNSREALFNGIDAYRDAFNFITSEPDFQEDDLFYFSSAQDVNEAADFLSDLTEVQDSLIYNRAAAFVATTEIWILTDGYGDRLHMEIEKDGAGNFVKGHAWGLDGCAFLFCSGAVEGFEISGTDVTITMYAGGWCPTSVTLTGTIIGSDITGGMYNGTNCFGPISGTFTGERVDTRTETVTIDFNRVFGSAGKAPLDIRAVLPEFDQYDEFIPGTFPGYPVLNGILPDIQTNDDLTIEMNLQPSGYFDIPTAAIIIDGDPGDWPGAALVHSDPSGDDDPDLAGTDIENVYMAEDGTNLYLAISLHDGNPIADGNTYYGLVLRYPYGRHSSDYDLQMHTVFDQGNWASTVQTGPRWGSQLINSYSSGYAAADTNFIEWKVPLSDIQTAIGTLSGEFVTSQIFVRSYWACAELNSTRIQLNTSQVSGIVDCPAHTSGNIFIYAYDGPDPNTARELGSTYVTGPGPYMITGLPIGANVYLFAFWDSDGNGIRAAGDYSGQSGPHSVGSGGTTVNFSVQEAGCPPCGDVNLDHDLTPGDALLAFQHYLAIADPPLDPCQLEKADVTQDEDITPADALCIFQKYLAIPSCLDDRPECPWD